MIKNNLNSSKLIRLAAIFFASISLFACEKSGDPTLQKVNFPEDYVIRVSTNIKEPLTRTQQPSTRAQQPSTRAGMTTDNLNDFFLFVENQSYIDYTYFAKMKKEGGEWKSYLSDGITPLKMLWKNKTENVDVIALRAPVVLDYQLFNSPASISIEQDQTILENLEKSDMLFMESKSVSPVTDLTSEGKINIIMKHNLSKLNLTLKLGTEFNMSPSTTDTNPISAVTIEGTSTKADWLIRTNSISNYSNFNPVNPYLVSYTKGEGDTKQAVAKYESILLPQGVSANNFIIKITIGAKTYSWTYSSNLDMNKDFQYNLTLNVGKDVITAGGFTTTPWSDGGSVDIETE